MNAGFAMFASCAIKSLLLNLKHDIDKFFSLLSIYSSST